MTEGKGGKEDKEERKEVDTNIIEGEGTSARREEEKKTAWQKGRRGRREAWVEMEKGKKEEERKRRIKGEDRVRNDDREKGNEKGKKEMESESDGKKKKEGKEKREKRIEEKMHKRRIWNKK